MQCQTCAMNYKVKTSKVTQMWNVYLPKAPVTLLPQTSHENIAMKTGTYAQDTMIFTNKKKADSINKSNTAQIMF